MRKIPRPAALLATGALLLLPLAGCGDDDDDDSGEAASTPATETSGGAAAGGTIDVSETDFALNPVDPTVSAGTVTINATNDGQTTHSIEVEGPGEEAKLEQDLAPGDSGSLTVDLSEPGIYEWFCPIGNHREMGMEGTITVQ
jgi:plastocyanin